MRARSWNSEPSWLTHQNCGAAYGFTCCRCAVHPNAISHRLYNCRRCRHQVQLCRRCDRGNRYCQRGCANEARVESLRRAGRRYQQSDRGRANHAARQQRYLEREAEKMTHHGSASASTEPPSADPVAIPAQSSEKTHDDSARRTCAAPRCARCLAPLSHFTRRHFLHWTKRARPPPR